VDELGKAAGEGDEKRSRVCWTRASYRAALSQGMKHGGVRPVKKKGDMKSGGERAGEKEGTRWGSEERLALE